VRTSFAALLLLALVGCDVKFGYFLKDRHTAEDAVADFRRFYAERNYTAIYDLGSPELKAAVSRDQFIAAAQASASHFGAHRSSSQAGASCFPNQVRLVYLTDYERGKATEWFAWSTAGDKARLVLYRISPGHDEVKNDASARCPS